MGRRRGRAPIPARAFSGDEEATTGCSTSSWRTSGRARAARRARPRRRAAHSWARSARGFPPAPRPAPVLVGGGVGIAPLAIWGDALEDATTLLGFRDAAHAEGAALIPEARVITDDDGFVTDLLRDELPGHVEVYACGPPPMLDAVAAMCTEHGVPGQLAMESGMACGFGACFGCVVPTKDGYVRLCVDGPVIEV